MLTEEHPQRVEFDQPQNVNYSKNFTHESMPHKAAFIAGLTVYNVFLSREPSSWTPLA